MFNEGDKIEDCVTVIVDDKQFICNRIKLAQHSPYFHAMFNGNFIEKDEKMVNIQQIEVNALNNILYYINDNNFYINYEELFDTLEAACMLQFDTIKQHCLERFINDLRITYSLQIWFKTEELDIHPLCEKAKCKSLLEFNSLKDSESFLLLDIKQLHTYLSNTLLYCDSELDVFETGMRWWYEFTKRSNNELQSELITKYLLVILSCIDYNIITERDVHAMLLYPDIKNNAIISDTLNAIAALLNDPMIEITPPNIESLAKQLLSCKKRYCCLLPCVVSSEFVLDSEKSKRIKSCSSVREMNVIYYDYVSKNMKKLFNSHLHFDSHCTTALKGCKVLAYKENILLFGGEYKYGRSDWNKNIWMYHTFQDRWELLTKMPDVRRHFKACIVDEKLFIVGGTGKYRIIHSDDMFYYNFQTVGGTDKYRIIHSDDMFYYNFQTGEWICNIQLPPSLYDLELCNHKNQLFMTSGNMNNSYGFLFNVETKIWLRLNITDPLGLVPKFPEKFIIFSYGDYIYIKGSYLIKLELDGSNLEVQQCDKVEPLYADKIGVYVQNNQLYTFTKHDTSEHKVYALHCTRLDNMSTELMFQVNDGFGTSWHINMGCFAFFHYSLTKRTQCISDFVF